MSIETDVKTTLDGHGNLSALVASRNYVALLPQGPTYPNTLTMRVDRDIFTTLDGGAGGGRENSRFSIEVRGTTYDSAANVADQVLAAMVAATLFDAVLLGQYTVPYEDEPNVFRISMDFSVWHN